MFASAVPQVFGHRGGLALGPENTRLAFARGLATGADGFECDVRLSADGVPVVIHDATLDRTTDATGPVAARTAAELSRVDATCRFTAVRAGDAVPAVEGVPRLDDVLAALPMARIIIELKDPRPAVAEAAVTVIRRLRAAERVCVGSFHHEVLSRVRALAPDLTTSASLREARWLLARARVHWPLASPPRFRALQVPVRAGRLHVVDRVFVARAHREQALVHVWTVNDPIEMRALLDLGVDGLISDRPDLAIETRDARPAANQPTSQ